MALGVTITRVLPLFPRGNFIQWDLVNPTESGQYLFSVYRSGSEGGPWTLLKSNAINAMNFTDALSTTVGLPPQPNQLSLSNSVVYRVTATPPSGQSNMAEAISIVEPKLTGRHKLLKRKMLYEEARTLKKINGVDVAVCKRMRWGERCASCFDKYAKEVVRGNCTACYGTGFTPGYHTPVITLARRSPTPVQVGLTPQGKADLVQTQVTMLDAPMVEDNDVLVFLNDNRRFLVRQQMQTELLNVPVHQKLVVTELARNAIEYRIPVDPLRNPRLF